MSHPGSAPERRSVVPVALPVLLGLGGDDRSRFAPDTGLNRYGCAAAPRPVLTLGSCTCSSPEEATMHALQPAWEAYAEAAGRSDAHAWLTRGQEEVREALAAHFGLGEAEVVLTPSGTDAEYVAAWAALGRTAAPVRSILVGAEEAGSGTALAAAGRRFSPDEPLRSAHGEPGEALDGMPTDRLRLSHVALRAPDGRPRTAEAIADEVEAGLTAAIARGEHCLLHVMAHSKTGLHAPRLDMVETWRRRWPGRVQVLVDAAQGRVAPHTVAEWVARGYWVLVTGSKFYGAPPFAGAVIFPDGHAPALAPSGLAAYLTRWDAPPSWAAAAAPLGPTPNQGLQFRWRAAIAHMQALAALPDGALAAIADAFGERFRRAFAPASWLVWHDVPADMGPFDASRPSVFSFGLRKAGRRLDMAALRGVHRALNGQGGLLTEHFHLGQPVLLGHDGTDEIAVLRIALGAPLAVRLATGDGASRLDWLEARFVALREALETVLAGLPAEAPAGVAP